MEKSKSKILLLGLIMLFCISGCAKQEDKVKKIRLAHDNNVQTPIHQAFLEFERLVEEGSNHQIDVVIFPGAQMGGVVDTFQQVRRGDVEMSASTTSNFTATIPEFAVWESFYMFDDEAHAKRVLEGEAGLKMMEPLERMNLQGIGYMELGFRNFSNSKRPIEKASDVKGIKMRGYNPLQIKAWSAAGAIPTSVSWNELFTSLQQNLIDGQECATTSFYNEKFYEAQKYFSMTKHVFTNFLWYANAEFMESLSKEEYTLILDAAKQTIDFNWNLVSKTEEEVLAKLEEENFQINEVDLEVRRKLGEQMNGAIREQIVAQCGQEIYDFVFAELEKERLE